MWGWECGQFNFILKIYAFALQVRVTGHGNHRPGSFSSWSEQSHAEAKSLNLYLGLLYRWQGPLSSAFHGLLMGSWMGSEQQDVIWYS